MEKPAVIFSEAGFKMFLDFVRSPQEVKADNSVDSLVKEYFARPDRPDINTDEPTDRMDDITKIVSDLLYNNPNTEFTSSDIHSVLVDNGFNVKPQGMAPTMKGVMARELNIIRVDAGVYAWGGPVAADDK